MEFQKRMDVDLPYYYHTSTHTQFQEGELPEFSEAKTRPKRRSNRVPCREQPAAFVSCHATLPVRGSLGVRAQFHNVPIDLPPPPSGPIHISEHSYSHQA